MKFFFEKDYFLEYDFIPNKGKETLIFLNGLTQTFEVWKNCSLLLEKEYQLVFVDLINQGKSSAFPLKTDFDQHAALIRNLLDHLEIKKTWMAGISYGSLVAQHFAINYETYLRGIVLISSFAEKTNYYHSIEISWEQALLKTGYRGFVETILPFVIGRTFFEKQNVQAENIIAERLQHPVNENSLHLLMLATKERKKINKELSEIKCPALILHGEEDILFPPEMANYLASLIKNSTLKIFSATGHSINIEQPQMLAKEINHFIQKHPSE